MREVRFSVLSEQALKRAHLKTHVKLKHLTEQRALLHSRLVFDRGEGSAEGVDGQRPTHPALIISA